MAISKILVRGLVLSMFLAWGNAQTKYGPACDPAKYPQSQMYCDGELIFTVQRAKLYKDQKTFVDRPLKKDPQDVLQAFNDLNIKGENLNEGQIQALVAFIEDNFDKNGTEFEPWDPEDWKENPEFLKGVSNAELRQWGSDLNAFWKELGRKIKQDVKDQKDRNSMYYVSHPVIVPGGRFKEFYYWDSYWIQRGLLVSEMYGTVKGMIQNFFEMVELLGFIPNGGRIYYQRSQPPLLLPMVDAYYEATKDAQFLKDNINVMKKEFLFFMEHRTVEFAIKQPDGSDKKYNMTRYAVDLTGPRPESYSEDYELIHSLVDRDNNTVTDELYANLKSGAESGWDFSSRWYVLPDNLHPLEANLTYTKTRDIIPVDLNSFTYWNAELLVKFCNILADITVCNPNEYQTIADQWRKSIHEVLWDETNGTWFDYDFVRGVKRVNFFPTNVAPLWVDALHDDKPKLARRTVKYLQDSGALAYPGGIPTSMVQTGLQWDFPNGWAPLNHLVIEALENSDETTAKELAFQLALKWVQSNHHVYKNTSAMFEKYDVSVFGSAGGGGEYEVVVGFGWTNGVILDFLQKYGSRLTVPKLGDIQTTTAPTSTDSSANGIKIEVITSVLTLGIAHILRM